MKKAVACLMLLLLYVGVLTACDEDWLASIDSSGDLEYDKSFKKIGGS